MICAKHHTTRSADHMQKPLRIPLTSPVYTCHCTCPFALPYMEMIISHNLQFAYNLNNETVFCNTETGLVGIRHCSECVRYTRLSVHSRTPFMHSIRTTITEESHTQHTAHTIQSWKKKPSLNEDGLKTKWKKNEKLSLHRIIIISYYRWEI